MLRELIINDYAEGYSEPSDISLPGTSPQVTDLLAAVPLTGLGIVPRRAPVAGRRLSGDFRDCGIEHVHTGVLSCYDS